MSNKEFGIENEISKAIAQACDEMIAGNLNNQIPLNMWQQVSGSKTNANVNAAIAIRANEILGGVMGNKTPVHPTDHVNKNQRSDHLFSSGK
jgi:fumarate hydratase class II